jgi:ubiquinone/menaquinone biosynthesis C-methylase UbiE
MKRIVTPELLDTDSGTPQEVADSLADLRGVNRKFGGIATTQAMIARVAQKLDSSSLSLLEVGAGSGDVPHNARLRLANRGLQLSVTLLDRAQSHLNHGAGNGTRAVVGDALSLPFANDSFDLVSCGLFAHHLSPDEVVQFMREGLRVCRTAVLINDLVRNPVHLALVYAAFPLYRSRLTRHDAPASVRAAYTPEEMQAMAAKTSAAKVEITRHYLYRMGVILWKK